MFTAHAAIELYAEVFEQAGRLDRLEAFASHFGADFYGLPRHDGSHHLDQGGLDRRPSPTNSASGTRGALSRRRIRRLAPGPADA